MLYTTVSSTSELQQILELNQLNLKQNIPAGEKETEGFVSWLYSLPLLQQMHNLLPSVIAKNNGTVVGYALSTVKEAVSFHPDLQKMMNDLQQLQYKNKSLFSYNFYCIGQICVEKSFRGKGLLHRLYQKHKELYSDTYDLLITEISSSNVRSMKAHERVGFKTVHTHHNEMDEWNVVIWDWK
jgi:predicted GNAT family N-acyltransferase